MTTIAALITARDAASTLPDLIGSLAGHVDHVVVGVDERTADQTREVAASLGAIVFDVSLVRDGVMDFAQGRNQTLNGARERISFDWFIWIDSDDVLAGPPDGRTPPAINLHDLIDETLARKADTETIWLPYIYHRDPFGGVLAEQYRERLIRTDACMGWQARLHEICPTKSGPRAIAAEGGGPQHIDRSGARIMVDHRNANQADRYERNAPILRKMFEEDPADLRTIREIGELEFGAHHYEASIPWFDRYLRMAEHDIGTPLEERWMAVLNKARAERLCHRVRESLLTADRALHMCPQYADAYFEIAYSYYLAGNYSKAIHWLEEGQRHGIPSGILQTSPLDYECVPFQILHEAYARVGDLDKALECVERALRYRPTVEDLIEARVRYFHLSSRKTSVESAVLHARFLLATNEPTKAKLVLDSLPAGAIEDFSAVLPLKKDIEDALLPFSNPFAVRGFAMQRPPAERPERPWLAKRLAGCERVLLVGGNAVALAKAGISTVCVENDPRLMQQGNFAAVEAGFMALVPAPESTMPATPMHLHDPTCHLAHEQECADPCLLPLCERTVHVHGEWSEGCELCGPVAMLPDMRTDAMAQYHVSEPERIPERIRRLGSFDAVVLDDVLNRCADPEQALKEAESISPRVLITVPDGTAPRLTDPGEVRAWSRQEIETLIWSRGRIVESHPLDGDQGRVGIEYRTGESIAERNQVSIFCGPGLEQWTPDQVDTTGLGGSETAVVHLAKHLVSLGLRVVVYAEANGTWDGVFYRHHTRWVPQNPVWAFVAWRNPTLFDAPINAERTFLWMHDIDAGDGITDERAKKISAVLAVSEWHAAHLRERHPNVADRIHVMRNGIEPERFAGTEERDPLRFIYVSSPDRGLERALVMWPFIKKAIPEATLHVYYGWENYDLMGRDPGFKNWTMDKAKADGVTWHGRVGQRELAREMMRSGALFYPGPHGFEETFCIAALEAQAAGCIPVTRDNGALPETNKYGILLPTAEATVNDYLRALLFVSSIDYLADEEERRSQMREWALTQTWRASAEAFVAISTQKAEQEEQVA